MPSVETDTKPTRAIKTDTKHPSQATVRNNKQIRKVLDTQGFSPIIYDKQHKAKTDPRELVRMKSPVQIWLAAP